MMRVRSFQLIQLTLQRQNEIRQEKYTLFTDCVLWYIQQTKHL